MAELITGDINKGIKSVGELSLRISKFDSYRLFTLYENVNERKVMDVSGNQRYYLVFKSPKKEIRIPEYEPNGYFEVDKVNGCILFKISKKNAEDILSMKTFGERIFHIVRVFEERDDFGKVLSVTDEVEVYNGKWGDDNEFSAFSTENKIDLLTKALAAQIDKNAKLLKEYEDLLNKYNIEVEKSSSLEKELEAVRSERDALQATLDEYMNNTHDGTLLSTDTKYIAFEEKLDNISFTEDQYNQAMNDLMTKGEVDLKDYDLDDPRIELEVKIYDSTNDFKINIYQNSISVGSAVYNQGFYKTVYANHDDVFEFKCVGVSNKEDKYLTLEYYPISNYKYKDAVLIEKSNVSIGTSGEVLVKGKINYMKYNEDGSQEDIGAVGNIGKLICYIN